ncbi:hypothetical protein ASPFODRAFT_57835 [Aspergillus luchuensis CBS 106.47]|uniref:Uncharacterized protein n=1 Tax=Aspergillus luchuensis (strain CBS 106.47) TaxID=1137211 RepID=A0A1M3TR74_ASPLC|nr:hypothetical protein ASPFODRAFT_57835 [Aspergillus luchuensis CBS 106.47]
MRSRPRASVERPLDTARLVLGFLDPGEGFSVGPGLPSFTRGSRIAAVAPSSIQHPSRASDLRADIDRTTPLQMEMLVLPAPLPREHQEVLCPIDSTILSAKYHTIEDTIAIAALALLSGRGQYLTIDYSQLHRATVAANPPSIDDAPCFAELLLPSDQQNPINRLPCNCPLVFRAAVRMLGSGLARALADSGNYCPSVPGRLAVGQSWK